MKTVTLQDIKRRGSKAISADDPLFLIVNSKLHKVLVSPEMFDMFVDAMEELEDIQAIEDSKNEPDIPWEEVFPEDNI